MASYCLIHLKARFVIRMTIRKHGESREANGPINKLWISYGVDANFRWARVGESTNS